MPTEVDQPVEDQTDQTQSAIALLAAQLLLQNSSDRSDEGSTTAMFWLPRVQAGIELVLLQYLIRTSAPLASAIEDPSASVTTDATGQTQIEPGPGSQVRQVAQEAARQASERVANVLAANVAQVQQEPAGARAAQAQIVGEEAARAAVVPAREQTRIDLARVQTGVQIDKVWHTRRDSKVRSSHATLNGKRLPIEQAFTTGAGNSLDHPGDPDAPLSETAGCRCRLGYIVRKATP